MAMGLKHECDSCGKQVRANFGAADLPHGWVPVTVGRPSSLAMTYDLCNECSKKPMAFGDISLTTDPASW